MDSMLNETSMKEMQLRGRSLAHIFNLKLDKKLKGNYITPWGSKGPVQLYLLTKKIINRGI